MIRYSSIWLVFSFYSFASTGLILHVAHFIRNAVLSSPSWLVVASFPPSIRQWFLLLCQCPAPPSSSMFTPALEFCRQGRPCAPIRLLNSQPWSSPCELWCHHELCQCHTNGHEGGRCGSCLPLEGPTIWEHGVGHWTCFEWSTEMAIHRRCAQGPASFVKEWVTSKAKVWGVVLLVKISFERYRARMHVAANRPANLLKIWLGNCCQSGYDAWLLSYQLQLQRKKCNGKLRRCPCPLDISFLRCISLRYLG